MATPSRPAPSYFPPAERKIGWAERLVQMGAAMQNPAGLLAAKQREREATQRRQYELEDRDYTEAKEGREGEALTAVGKAISRIQGAWDQGDHDAALADARDLLTTIPPEIKKSPRAYSEFLKYTLDLSKTVGGMKRSRAFGDAVTALGASPDPQVVSLLGLQHQIEPQALKAVLDSLKSGDKLIQLDPDKTLVRQKADGTVEEVPIGGGTGRGGNYSKSFLEKMEPILQQIQVEQGLDPQPVRQIIAARNAEAQPGPASMLWNQGLAKIKDQGKTEITPTTRAKYRGIIPDQIRYEQDIPPEIRTKMAAYDADEIPASLAAELAAIPGMGDPNKPATRYSQLPRDWRERKAAEEVRRAAELKKAALSGSLENKMSMSVFEALIKEIPKDGAIWDTWTKEPVNAEMTYQQFLENGGRARYRIRGKDDTKTIRMLRGTALPAIAWLRDILGGVLVEKPGTAVWLNAAKQAAIRIGGSSDALARFDSLASTLPPELLRAITGGVPRGQQLIESLRAGNVPSTWNTLPAAKTKLDTIEWELNTRINTILDMPAPPRPTGGPKDFTTIFKEALDAAKGKMSK